MRGDSANAAVSADVQGVAASTVNRKGGIARRLKDACSAKRIDG